MSERDDATEPREDDLPDKPQPQPVDTDDLDLDGEDVPEGEFLPPDRAREDPTIDDEEDDEDDEPEADPTAIDPDEPADD